MGRRETEQPSPPVSDRPESELDDLAVTRIEDAALRQTFRVGLDPAALRALDQAVSAAEEADVTKVSFPDLIDAAVFDLHSLLRYLEYWADNGGDRPDRNEIHLAAAVLDTLPLLSHVVDSLRLQVERAREGSDEEEAVSGSNAVDDLITRARHTTDLEALNQLQRGLSHEFLDMWRAPEGGRERDWERLGRETERLVRAFEERRAELKAAAPADHPAPPTAGTASPAEPQPAGTAPAAGSNRSRGSRGAK